MVGAHLNWTPKPFTPPTPIPFNSLPFNPIIPALAHISYLPLGKLLHLSKLVSSSVKWGWGSYTHRMVVRVKPNSLCRVLSACVLLVATILALSSPHLSLSFAFLAFPLLLATPCMHQVCPPGGPTHCSSCPAVPALEGSQPLISLPPFFLWWQLCHLSTSAPSSSQISSPLVSSSSFHKYFLSTYYMPGFVLDVEETRRKIRYPLWLRSALSIQTWWRGPEAEEALT